MEVPMTRNPSYPPSSLRFDWVMAILAALLMGGVIQDGWAHAHGLVDQSFFTPWHAIMYSCMALSGVVLGIMGLRNLTRGYTFRRGLPFGYWTSLIGVIVFATGGVFDLFWHTIYGIEMDIVGLISISHLWLGLGGALVFSGPIRSIAHRYASNSGGWKIAAPLVFCCAALLTLLAFFTQYASLFADNTSEEVMAPSHAATTGGELYTVRIDGSRETRLLTLDNEDIYGAAVSPRGNRIAYRVQAGSPDGTLLPSDIHTIGADGSNARRLTHDGTHDTQVSWSQDAKHLAYVSMPAGTSGDFKIITINADGSGAHTVVDGSTTVQFPSWSPDGSSLVFQSRNGLHQEMATVGVRGGAIRWLPATVDGSDPFWARNGKIYFSDAAGALAFTDASGTTATRLHILGTEPALSPDGKRIAYTASAGGVAQIFVANLDGSNPVNVTRLAAADATHAAWLTSSDIAFTAAGRPQPIRTGFGKAYSIDAVIVTSLITIALMLLLVRRWRMPAGSMTLLLALSGTALATQSDTYWDIPAALGAGILADALLAVFGERVRSGNPFHAFAAVVPFATMVFYEVAVRVHDAGLGWPPNMTIGAPFIAGFVGLLVSFCYEPPLGVGSPVVQAATQPQPDWTPLGGAEMTR
jgi:dipeptidyl aminopeptidase/acylaminoacyl peptidase